MKKFAYVRVSIADQNTARQLEGMPEVDRVYEEKISGKNTKRPQLQMPYPGLRPFEAEHAPLFFGREAQVSALLRQLEDHSRVAFVPY